MQLRKSTAYRGTGRGKDYPVHLFVKDKPGYADVEQVTLHFNLGTNTKHEMVLLQIDPSDFDSVVAAMYRADPEKLLAAFAKAVLARVTTAPTE